ncbi:MAG: hypothetical protein QM770_12800 [Tepidisphaeraceae bacterium]
MSRKTDYLPFRESELVTWTGDFVATLTPLVTTAGFPIQSERLTEYVTTRNRFLAAFAKASNPSTRVKSAITEKNDEKKTLIRSTRSMVEVLQAWPQMTNSLRDDLGISQRGKKPTPSPIPPQAFVKVEGVNGREVTLSIQQSKTTKTKPRGAQGANVMIAYSDEAPESTLDYTLATVTTRTKTVITLDAVREACTVWISAFWFNGRGASGPASDPQGVNLSAIAVKPATMKLKKAA